MSDEYQIFQTTVRSMDEKMTRKKSYILRQSYGSIRKPKCKLQQQISKRKKNDIVIFV